MLLLKLLVRNAFRHRLRAALTVAGVAVAILAFGLLRTVIDTWHAGVEAAAANRLVTRNAISLVFPLPLSQRDKIRNVENVSAVSYGNWFGGIYVDEKNFFANFCVEPASYLAIYPEFLVPEEQRLAFLKDRKGALAGRKLMERFGWKLGDTITLRGTIYPGDWPLTIRAVYEGAHNTVDETQLLFHWAYLDETMQRQQSSRAGEVGFYMIQIRDETRAAETARAIDALFKNSRAETLTETEKAFTQGFLAMSEAILVAIRIVSYVVIVIILAVAANTMAMSARERTAEYAAMKTVGFGGGTIGLLIVGESLVLALAGTGLGLAGIPPGARAFGHFLSDYFPFVEVKVLTFQLGAVLGLGVGLLAGLFPAISAARLRIAEGLRRLG
ncbi:MAG: ABC transporter permease [Desulfovibrio sp.]|nr:ABC transporter permease [Desulfovibrio sp.]